MTELLRPTRRSLLRGLGLLLAAPAIVRAASIMPVRPIRTSIFEPVELWSSLDPGALNESSLERMLVEISRFKNDPTKVITLSPTMAWVRPEARGAFEEVMLFSTSHPVRA